jgi:3-oxoacyl-[acyl-carrier protein] reductase
MADRYTQLVRSRPGSLIARPLGLPRPERLQRATRPGAVIDGTVLLGAAPAGRLIAAAASVLANANTAAAIAPGNLPASAANAAGLQAVAFDPERPGDARFKALIFDASHITDSTGLVELQRFFQPAVRALQRSGRVIVLALPPEEAGTAHAFTAQRALEGFTRSLGKELGPRGTTVQLVQVAPGAEDQLAGTLRFMLSPRSAYVSGQVVRVGAATCEVQDFDWERPLSGRVALVTGAARGIGAEIAATLAREGASVVGLDIPQGARDLERLMRTLGGLAIPVDITEPGAPDQIAGRFPDGLDILVHNAGVTRDRTIAKMPVERWSELMEINLSGPERINDALLKHGLLRRGARIVCVSSIAAVAGNAGQTNYAASKAGLIGMVQALALDLAEQGVAINAVAPGFIETAMTAAMPFAVREAGRRLNSLRQGGLPQDVAETVAWLAGPGAAGVNGSVIRVCGQSLLGA